MDRSSRLKIACPSCTQKLDTTGYEPFEEVACPTCGCVILVPKPFGEFLLEEKIGRGGMAVVYRALDMTLHRDVAIKVLDETIAAEEGASGRFLREGRAAAAISHINVVPIYSSGEAEGLPYLVMQYMEGLSLDRQISKAKQPIPLRFCLRAGAEAARGLEAALREGIIHHDVKPANILIDADGVAKVGDFGLAQLFGDDGHGDEETNQWATPYYVSPEKVRDGREDYRGDIYSLGATLYHLIAGVPPFSGGSERAVMDARLEVPAPPLERHREGLPPAVLEIIHSMLRRDRDNRPQDYDTIAGELDQARRELETPYGVGSNSAAPPVPTDPADGPNIPRLVVSKDRARRRGRLSHYQRSSRRSGGMGFMDWFLVACMGAVLAALLAGRIGCEGFFGVEENAAPPPTAPASTGPDESEKEGADAALKRPRPRDFDFQAARDSIEAYLRRLPYEQRPRERERLKRLVGTRSHLANSLNRHGYSMPRNGLLLEDEQRVTGRLVRIDGEGFEVADEDQNAAVRIPWERLALEQILDLFDFLIDRWDLSGGRGDRSPYAAQEALRAAAFSSWYDFPERSDSYLDHALELDPQIRKEAAQLFPSRFVQEESPPKRWGE